MNEFWPEMFPFAPAQKSSFTGKAVGVMTTRNMILAGLFAALLALSSQIAIPIGPVPHTLQIFFVLLAGIVLGSRLGSISVAVWVLLGSFGLPVFAQGKGGLAVLAGPTGGFLFGFIIAAFLVGWLAENSKLTTGRTAIYMLTGLVAAYIIGVGGFMASFKYFLNKPMTLKTAVSVAVVPFMPFDIVKALMAAYIGTRVRQALIRSGLIK
ncbi:MAG: biotin transporter BioY [Negativicutes bacterium]